MFSVLMVMVVLWAMWLLYIEQGRVEPDPAPASSEPKIKMDADQPADMAEIYADSEAVQAPRWDSADAGEDVPFDSAAVDSAQGLGRLKNARGNEEVGAPSVIVDRYRLLKHNVKLAHTHINGLSLLYFALGVVFLFTNVPRKIKKTVYIVFGFAIVIHTIGLSGAGFHSIYDDMVALSGVAILVMIVYMTLMVIVELWKRRASQ